MSFKGIPCAGVWSADASQGRCLLCAELLWWRPGHIYCLAVVRFFELNSLTDFLFLLVKLLIREPCRVLITRLIETGRQYTVYFM